jgi:hypothetical protein
MGIARAFYKIRHEMARRLKLKGQLTVGMLNGYKSYRDQYTIEQYYEKVKAGEIFDPTVSVQERIGFEISGFMKDYLNDPTCGNSGALIILPSAKKVE